MKVNKALNLIDEIHGHLAKTEVYRGYRSLPIAFTGFLALLGAATWPWVYSDPSPRAFVLHWVGLAMASALIVGSEIARRYYSCSTPSAKRLTLRAVGQFLPCFFVGAGLTAIVAVFREDLVCLLPGLWASLFGLGIFASRPYMPRATGWLGLFYLLGGLGLLALGCQGRAPSSWGMAAVFGPGQFLTALVLYWNLERKENV